MSNAELIAPPAGRITAVASTTMLSAPVIVAPSGPPIVPSSFDVIATSSIVAPPEATRGARSVTGAGGGRAARRHRDVDDAPGFEDQPRGRGVVRRVAGHAEHDVAALRFGAVRRRARGRRVREQPRRRAERDPAAVGRTRVRREEFDASALRTGRVDGPVDVDAAVVGRETHAVRAERRIREQREIAFAHAHQHRVGEAARLETRGERGEIGKAQRVERESPVARRDGRRARRCAPQRAVELHVARHGGHDELSGCFRTGGGHVDDAVSVGLCMPPSAVASRTMPAGAETVTVSKVFVNPVASRRLPVSSSIDRTIAPSPSSVSAPVARSVTSPPASWMRPPWTTRPPSSTTRAPKSDAVVVGAAPGAAVVSVPVAATVTSAPVAAVMRPAESRRSPRKSCRARARDPQRVRRGQRRVFESGNDETARRRRAVERVIVPAVIASTPPAGLAVARRASAFTASRLPRLTVPAVSESDGSTPSAANPARPAASIPSDARLALPKVAAPYVSTVP